MRNCFSKNHLLLTFLISFSFLFGCLPKPQPPRTPSDLLSEIEPYYKVFKPASPPPYATVVLLHGAQIVAWRDDIESIKDELIKANYAVVFVDSYADRGINAKSLFRGKMLPRERSGDLLVTVDWLNKQPWVDKDKIAVWGQSHGAATIMDTLVLCSKNENPTSLTQIPSNGLHGLKAAVLFSPWCQDRVMGFELIKAVENAWTIPIPILAIIPGKDKYAPLCTKILTRHAEEGFSVEIVNYPGAHHSFSAEYFGPSEKNENYDQELTNQAYDQTIKFLNKVLKNEDE